MTKATLFFTGLALIAGASLATAEENPVGQWRQDTATTFLSLVRDDYELTTVVKDGDTTHYYLQKEGSLFRCEEGMRLACFELVSPK